MLSASEITSMYATVLASLDVSLPVYRRSTAPDGYGHDTESYPGSPTHTIACNVIKPTATQLQLYAGVIGSKRALTLRVMNDADIQETDQVVYDLAKWEVNSLLDAASYSVVKRYLMVTVS